jgi:hypothetical protein
MPSDQTPASSLAPRNARGRIPEIWLFVCATLCIAGAALSGAGCAATGGEATGQENPQTRARRAGNPSSESPKTTSRTGPTKMPDTNVEKNDKNAPTSFYTALKKALKAREIKLETVCDTSDPVARRVLEDYGAIFLAANSVTPPPVCVFTNEADVLQFQEEAKFTTAIVGGDRIELQPAAMSALLEARAQARAVGLDITPRGGEEAARRSYMDTLRLWNTRFLPALTYWQRRGRLSKEQTTRLRSLPLHEQVREVLELEKDGIFFSKDFSKSILYSIAAPGTSQHLALLALDVEQFADERVRRILAAHGWFQTVKSDLPHFTYLGLAEKDLPAHGLRPVISGKQLFWIPNVGE